MAKVRCNVCRGQKKVSGMGGITRDCRACSGTGEVDAPELITLTPVEIESKVETVPFSQVLKEMDVPNSVIVEMANAATNEVAAAINNKNKRSRSRRKPIGAVENITESVVPAPIFAGYSDALMTALLDEPKMPLQDWKKKYMRNNELFIIGKDGRGVDQIVGELLPLEHRNTIRLLYAQSKPVAPRKVNLKDMQDNMAAFDPDYARYEREQKAKAELESVAR